MAPKRPWTAAHDEFVRSHTNMTASEIGEAIGHHNGTVARHARALGVTLRHGVGRPYSRQSRRGRGRRGLDFSAMNLLMGVS